MKALITGAAGFVGYYLIKHLQEQYGWDIYAAILPGENLASDITAQVYEFDILDENTIIRLLREVKPDYIFHLASQSSVALSWREPALTVDVNIKGTLNLLDAIRSVTRQARVLLIGSGEEYGMVRPEEIPIQEENLLRPGNIYAATKAAQNLMGNIYSSAYGMDIVMVRAFNHIGPRQTPVFVVADFCKQVAEIEKGLRESPLRVGNLRAKRDFTDVRDIVRAYGLLMLKGRTGEIYNVGSGKAVAIETMLDLIISRAHTPVWVEIDKNKLRPLDIPIIEADIEKLRECTEWQPIISLDQTIEDTLNYWRETV